MEINAEASLINCSITKNEATMGSGIFCRNISQLSVCNSILWADKRDEIYCIGNEPVVTHSNMQGGWPGTGNINDNPLFVDPADNDLHLLYTSPCRNAGDNSSSSPLDEDFEGDPRIAEGIVDIGADEFYTHLYYRGDTAPGGLIQGKFVGMPGTSPIGLWLGSGVLDPPLPSMFGPWHPQEPWIHVGPLGPIPSDGVMVLPARLPPTPGPYSVPMQALIGDELTNLCVLQVE